MNQLRRSSRIARLVAGWVLAWFVAMAAAPFASLAQASGDCGASAAHAGHEGHEGHIAAACDGDPASGVHAAHAERATGAGAHCPVCMHAAAPPPALVLAQLVHAAPDTAATPASIEPLRVHTAAPPPPRGPPRLS